MALSLLMFHARRIDITRAIEDTREEEQRLDGKTSICFQPVSYATSFLHQLKVYRSASFHTPGNHFAIP